MKDKLITEIQTKMASLLSTTQQVFEAVPKTEVLELPHVSTL